MVPPLDIKVENTNSNAVSEVSNDVCNAVSHGPPFTISDRNEGIDQPAGEISGSLSK